MFLVAMHELKVDRLVNWLAGILRRRNMGVNDIRERVVLKLRGGQ